MTTLKETIDNAIKNNEDISEDFYVGRDFFDVNYDAEYNELVIETHYRGKKHDDDDDLMTSDEEDWGDYEGWNWPEGDAVERD